MRERERERVVTFFCMGKYIQNEREYEIYSKIMGIRKSQNKRKIKGR